MAGFIGMASDPWQGHEPGVLLVLLFVGPAILMGLIVYLCSRLAPDNLRRYTPHRACRDLSLAAVASGVALYTWGLLHLFLTERQEQGQECELRRPGGEGALVGLRGDFLPLRLVCETSYGSGYEVVVPGYINPAFAFLLWIAFVAAVASGVLHQRRQRVGGRG
ncbi:hypothetical protein [Streptomyces sp. NPDC093795]|uniref:hypothetical protein n=1 Tax=Streptomyces sp. NPDC093795 TaxID=3366051 RepID=UPI00382732B9